MKRVIIGALFQGALCDMNWWDFPWQFVRPRVIDLTLGWGMRPAS